MANFRPIRLYNADRRVNTMAENVLGDQNVNELQRKLKEEDSEMIRKFA